MNLQQLMEQAIVILETIRALEEGDYRNQDVIDNLGLAYDGIIEDVEIFKNLMKA